MLKTTHSITRRPLITNSTIEGNGGYGIYLVYSTPTIANSVIEHGIYANDTSSVAQLSKDMFINYNGSYMNNLPMESLLTAMNLTFTNANSSSYIGFLNNATLAYGGELKNFGVPYSTTSSYNTICGPLNGGSYGLVSVTVDNGVVWEFGSNDSLNVGNSSYHCGELIANGATFTGTSWSGINFYNATPASVFNGTVSGSNPGSGYGALSLVSSPIIITGSTIIPMTGNSGHGVYLSSSSPTIANSTIENGIYANDTSSITQLSNDTFINYNGSYMINLPMESLLTANNLTFTNANSSSYIGFLNNATLAYGGELKNFGVPYSTTSSYNTICGPLNGGSYGLVSVTVDNGVVWEFGSNDSLNVGNSSYHCGELIANGATFTGTSWSGINFYNATPASVFNGTVSGSNPGSGYGALSLVSSPIIITGSTIIPMTGNSGHGVYLSSSSPTIANSTIENGIYANDTSSITQLSNDTFINYNGSYMINLPMESLLTANNLTFTNANSSSYIGFLNNATLAYGGELKNFGVPYSTTSSYNTICGPLNGGSYGLVSVTVDNGVVWEFGSNDSLNVGNSSYHCGELIANGATFTGTSWSGINFYNATPTSIIKNSSIYGGSSSYGSGSIYLSSSSIQITGSTIQDSPGNGIYCYNSTPLLWGNTISSNTNYGIYIYDASPIIEYNTIASNKYGIYAYSSPLLRLYNNNFISDTNPVTNATPTYSDNIDARFNWWGSDLTPTSISQGVSYNPWYGAPVGGNFSVTDVFISSNPYAINSISTTDIMVSLNLTATSQLGIIPTNGEPLSSSAINMFTQTGQDFTVSWNGTDMTGQTVTAGTYYYRIDSQNGSFYAIPVIGTINVINSAPIAYISSPGVDQVFSTSAGIPVSGMAYTSATLSGFSYTLEVGVGDAPQTWDTISSGVNSTIGSPPANYASLGTIGVSYLNQGGVYTVRLTVTNNGISSRYMQRILVLYTYGWNATPWLLSPINMSGAPTATHILGYSSVGGVAFSISIINSGSSVVRTLSGTSDDSGMIVATWGGKDDSGNYVPDGTYTVQGAAYDSGVTSIAANTTQTTIDTTPPQSSISYPTNGQVVTDTVSISGTTTDSVSPAYFKDYLVEVGSGNNPGAYQVICSSSTPVSNGTLCSWNTQDYATGSYTLLLYSEDGAGNTSTATTSVTIGNLVISSVSEVPIMFNPSAGGSISVSFAINMPATVSLNMYPEETGISGTLISTVSQTFSNAGTYTIPWNGTNSSGIPVQDDAYIYTLYGSALAGSSQSSFTAYSPSTTTSLAYTLTTYNTLYSGGTPNYNPYQNQYPYFVITPAPSTGTDAGRISLTLFTMTGGVPYPFVSLMNSKPFSGLSPSYVTYWDGRDTAGNIITPGAYNEIEFPDTDKVPSVAMRANYVIAYGSVPEIAGINIAPPYPQTDPYTITLSYNQYTNLEYSLSVGSDVTITASDGGPQNITLINGQYQAAGAHSVPLNFLNTSNPEQFLIKEVGGAYTLSIMAVNPVNGATETRRTTINITP